MHQYQTKRKIYFPKTENKTNNLFNLKDDTLYGVYGKHQKAFAAWVFARCFARYFIPVFLLIQLPFILIGLLLRQFDLMPAETGSDMRVYLVPLYAFILYKAQRRFVDYMAVYRYIANAKYYTINRRTNQQMDYADDEKEAFRLRVNKGWLFPSRTDLEVITRIEQNAKKSRQNGVLERTEKMLAQVSMAERALEHESAYRIADEKVSDGAPVNEYDEMVKTNGTRTIKEMHPHFG